MIKEQFVSREEFNNGIADEAAQSCVDWSNLERRKEALRYIIKQIWNEAITEREAQIRKDVLEEAAQHFDCHENGCPVLINGMICTCKNRWPWIGEAIRALAERPAPAGEVKEKSDG